MNTTDCIDERMTAFIGSQTCASICGVHGGELPFCFTCFYAFDQERGLLYFKSSAEVFHSRMIRLNPRVAGTILPDQLNKWQAKGIQFEGLVLSRDHPDAADSFTRYYKKHPAAMARAGEVFTIQINQIKMTDSTLGFGKKYSWCRSL